MANSTKGTPDPTIPKTSSYESIMKQGAPLSKRKETIESLQLTTKDKKSITLTSTQLEKWFANLQVKEMQQSKREKELRHPLDIPELASTYLSHYGLRTSRDVITFLKTPAGREVQSMIINELAEMAAINDAIHQQQLDSEIRRQRALAALLLGLLYKKEAQAKDRNIELQKEIDKKLHSTTSTTDNYAESQKRAAANAQAYNAYQASIDAMEKKLKEKIQESEDLEAEMDLLEEEELMLASRYEHLEDNLASLDHFGILLNTLSMNPEERQQTLDNLQAQIDQLREQSAHEGTAEPRSLSTMLITLSLLQKQIESPESTLKFMEDRLTELQTTLKEQAKRISSSVVKSKDTGVMRERMEELHEHHGLHVQSEGLKDIISVMKGEKTLWGFNGLPVTSFTDAAFILSRGRSIVFDNETNKYYLLESDQSPENFRSMSLQAKAMAAENYERSRPDIASLKVLVRDNRTVEESSCMNRRLELSVRSETMQKEILLITNQLTRLQSDQANLLTLMKQSNQDIPSSTVTTSLSTPTLKPTMSPNNKASQSTGSSYAQGCKHLLLLMKTNPTRESIERLRELFKGPDGKLSPALDSMLREIKYGRPIPEQTMRNLLQNLNRFGVSANKRNVTSTPDQLETRQSPESTAPVPYFARITPKPYS
ncbi:hypothetical protein [Legionella cardiaca]|uniref:LidA long coiled-coil domain-containing protein n=1 Tax=Legionella cardiaca TaxID=1071983 RepID=A0ABY8AWI8_9GAMM|nr:hypothetical protein [Legionella cardiaca]WED43855.1 hypothetical protein PXX05_03480 [Legionella cardiaca]